VSLGDAADLCVDLARILDSRDITALLERAAGVLDAKGVIVWAADTSGSVLQPSLAYGYPQQVIMRLGSLGTDADNVTSLAFRMKRLQVLPGAGSGTSGAIAVPLVTAAGCVGVLSAETRDPRPNPDVVAVTKIIAAQFAALIGPAGQHDARAAEA
jgi:GAF domain-containing protein